MKNFLTICKFIKLYYGDDFEKEGRRHQFEMLIYYHEVRKAMKRLILTERLHKN